MGSSDDDDEVFYETPEDPDKTIPYDATDYLNEDPDKTIIYDVTDSFPEDHDSASFQESIQATIKNNRIEAYRRLLDHFDVFNFHEIPKFIVESFFGDPSYKKRLLTSAFGFLNGISPEQLIEMLFWRPIRTKDHIKILALYEYFKLPFVNQQYFSYHASTRTVRFLNGSVKSRNTK